MKKTRTSQPKPKLTDAERHKRFVEMAHKLDIPDNADLSPDYFKKLIKRPTSDVTSSRHGTKET